MTDVVTALHLGHSVLDLVGIGVALTAFAVAVVLAVVLDRRTDRESVPHRAAQERTER